MKRRTYPKVRIFDGNRWVVGRIEKETQRGRLVVARRVQRQNRNGRWIFDWKPFRKTFHPDDVVRF